MAFIGLLFLVFCIWEGTLLFAVKTAGALARDAAELECLGGRSCLLVLKFPSIITKGEAVEVARLINPPPLPLAEAIAIPGVLIIPLEVVVEAKFPCAGE